MILLTFPSITTLIATPGSGKTYLIKDIIYQTSRKKVFNYIVVFCSTAFDNEYNYLDNKYVHHVYDEEVLDKVLKLQQTNNELSTLIIFDDVIGSINFQTDLWKKIITQYRHYRMSLIIATQYIKSIPTLMRECVSYVLVFKTDKQRTLKELYDQYGGCFNNLLEFKDFIVKNTQNYNVIVTNTKESEKNKKFSVYRAPVLPPFQILQ